VRDHTVIVGYGTKGRGAARTLVAHGVRAGQIVVVAPTRMSRLSPSAGRVMEDLITYGSGLDLVERPVTKAEAGRSPRELRDLVVAVKRGHRLLDHDDPEAAVLEPADRIIAIQRAVA
jgi:voltage-gated potassium channel Kch